jgi:hypothetical protein
MYLLPGDPAGSPPEGRRKLLVVAEKVEKQSASLLESENHKSTKTVEIV